jgi:hypothetical protein
VHYAHHQENKNETVSDCIWCLPDNTGCGHVELGCKLCALSESCYSTRSCSPDVRHNDARNMLRLNKC